MSVAAAAVRAPMAATVLQLQVRPADRVRAGAPLLVLESMKMEHELRAEFDAEVLAVRVAEGVVAEHEPLLDLRALESEIVPLPMAHAAPGDGARRADLREAIERHAFTLDANRPAAVARRHAASQRTARENIADQCDAGSFVEYGALAVAAQRSRRPLDESLDQIKPGAAIAAPTVAWTVPVGGVVPSFAFGFGRPAAVRHRCRARRSAWPPTAARQARCSTTAPRRQVARRLRCSVTARSGVLGHVAHALPRSRTRRHRSRRRVTRLGA